MKKLAVPFAIIALISFISAGIAFTVYGDSLPALRWRADHGSIWAAHRLGMIYSTPPSALQYHPELAKYRQQLDYIEANKWYRKAADLGDAQCQYDLGVSYHYGSGVKQDDVQSAEWYKKAAAQKYPSAELHLGNYYLQGIGVKKDEETGVALIRRAMDDGSTAAQYQMAMLYLSGRGVKKDYAKAAGILKKYVKENPRDNLHDAENILGALYMSGQGVKQDKIAGAKLIYRSANAGNADGQYSLGRILLTGDGVRNDTAKARVWLKKSSAQGNDDARRLLDYLDHLHKKLSDTSLAMQRWQMEKAKTGDATAAFNLGIMSYNGAPGVQKDIAKAATWFRRSADQGNAAAQMYMGRLYEHGEGVKQDWHQAAFWYALSDKTAAAQSHQKTLSSYALTTAESHLGEDDIARIKTEVAAWKPVTSLIATVSPAPREDAKAAEASKAPASP
ncbi:MAG: hypothetical protein GC185_05945 [Alphaproteobacteria bacterium]|nr:hypothetical protein [Alphaproteobacteria bacterium]